MPAMSEYAKAATNQRISFQPPSNLEEVARWVFWLLAAYLAIRLLLAVMRGPGRR